VPITASLIGSRARNPENRRLGYCTEWARRIQALVVVFIKRNVTTGMAEKGV
jgi:hypothetical protein